MAAPETISNRHEGDLNGALAPFASTQQVTVRVCIPAALAAMPAIQHTAWMVLNLLMRTDGVVKEVLLDCPEKVDVHDRTVPFGDARALRERLIEAANLIGPLRVRGDDGSHADRSVQIGPNASAEGDVAALGSGWWGGVALRGVEPGWAAVDLESPVPFGPYVAAAQAVADIYLRARHARILSDSGPAVYGWDCWTQSRQTAPTAAPEPEVDLTEAALAGVGAVGSVWMHAIWAYRSAHGIVTVVDDDDEGVADTNLNRGVLFTRSDINQPKAAVAAAATPGGVTWNPIRGRFEQSGARPLLLVSAVDTNNARDALQAGYAPLMLGGSTRDLRAEVLRVGEAGVGACLRCYCPPEARVSDDRVRTQARGDSALMSELAYAMGTGADDVSARLSEPGCDEVSEQMLAWLRQRIGDPELSQFAVGFVSVAAGAMLAAETIRVLADPGRPAGASQSFRFQFFQPSRINGVTPELRDRTCPKCAPGRATEIWQKRQADLAI